MTTKYPYLGFGVGLRALHYETILSSSPDIDWFEIISEDFLVTGGMPLEYLDKIAERYPVVMHGVSMSLGSADALNWDYLKKIKKLMQRINPVWVSDHCCWTGVDHVNLHDLMPMPYTDEAVKYMVMRIKEVQDFLERPLVIENVSSYITYQDSGMAEWEFLSHICSEAGCLLLLDINNVYVSAFNHAFDAKTYIDNIPVEYVQQFHLAGHRNYGSHIIDTHDETIIEPVWGLYRYALERFGKVSTLIERDSNIPPLKVMIKEMNHAKSVYTAVMDSQVVA
jgi:uncharacterized protein (UPF0276 family)